MKKIYLFCSGGMSTSILAQKMQKVADEYKVPVKITAFAHNKIDEIIKNDTPDCILLGPQVKYMYQETIDKYGNLRIPIAIIDSSDYGTMNGEKVLKTAVKLIKENKK